MLNKKINQLNSANFVSRETTKLLDDVDGMCRKIHITFRIVERKNGILQLNGQKKC